ncbi:MAG: PHP domain-containing protein [Planctomycetota bacterium]|jgi:predicted metal-dependent phosphoesterase TrpH
MSANARTVDLHTHSNCSDGTLSPAELVEEAVWSGLTALAITDHDSVSGVPEAVAKGQELSIEVIAGVEISCEFDGKECHILGYFIDDLECMSIALTNVVKMRHERMREMVRRVNEVGLDLSYEDVKAQAQGNAIGRPHLARVMKAKGYVKTIGQAFERFIGDGCSACVEKKRLATDEAIDAIHASGGMAFLAHPAINDMHENLSILEEQGLDGLEAYYSTHSPDQVKTFLNLAEQHNLLVTGGSDFHGPEVPGRGLGNPAVSYEVLERIRRHRKRGEA